MNALLFTGLAVIIIAAIICILGGRKKKSSLIGLAFVLVMGVATTALILHATPTETHEYRVAYSKDATIVVIDDTDGVTVRYDLDKIAHADVVYGIGDYVVVVTTGANKAVYIAPTGQIMPAKTTDSDG